MLERPSFVTEHLRGLPLRDLVITTHRKPDFDAALSSYLVYCVAEDRIVISVDPEANLSLKGLGEALERTETQKRAALGRPRHGAFPRPGYRSSDPSYDGRNPIHDYTIVYSPRNGTIMTFEEVLGGSEGPGSRHGEPGVPGVAHFADRGPGTPLNAGVIFDRSDA